MNRRAFFAGLLAAGTAGALDPERLLWTPGAKLISIPAPRFPTAGMMIDYQGLLGIFPKERLIRAFGPIADGYAHLSVGESRTLFVQGEKVVVARVQGPWETFDFRKALPTYNRIPK